MAAVLPATALQHTLTIVSRKVSDFSRVGLALTSLRLCPCL
jgi:hypothetical protein